MNDKIRLADEEKAFLWEAAHLYRDLGRGAEALKILAGLEALYPRHEEIRIAQGTVYGELRDWPQALSHYYQALEINPGCARAEVHLGELYLLGLNDPPQAMAHFERAVSLDEQGDAGMLARHYLALVASLNA